MKFVTLLTLLFTCLAANADREIITELAIKAADRYQINREVVLAIIEVESSFNPDAVGLAGEVGVMQLHPKFHEIPKTLEAQIDTGVKFLSDVKARCKPIYKSAWMICYNRGTNAPRLITPYNDPYFKKVQQAIKKHRSEYAQN